VIDHLLRDIRFSLRGLAKSPGFTVITILSLALGIGGSTAMYSVIYGVILNPFAYRDVDRLVSIQLLSPQGRSNYSYYPIDEFVEIAGRSTPFTGVIASTWSDVTLTGQGDPLRLRGNHCTMNTFEVMGVPPLLGRATIADDALPGAAPVAILGYKFWQRQFNGSSGVLGAKLTLNGKVRTVIGVMPRRFMWRGADVYLPEVFRRGESIEGAEQVHLLGRLKPDITLPQAATALQPIFDDLRRTHPNDIPDKWRIELRTFKETFPSGIIEALWILFGAVGLLLLISCVNVSSLLLSRMATRQREIAIRSAVGAGRGRLISQFLTETLVLALCGGPLGILAAYGALHGIIAMVPPDTIPDEAEISLNAPVLAFTLAISLLTAVLVGLAPALQFSGRDIIASLKEMGRGSSGGTRQHWLRNALVVGEIALSLMLLVGAGLMIRTLASIQGADLGIPRDRILTLRIPFSRERYPTPESRNIFLQSILRRIDQVPGVLATGVNSGLPPIGNWTSQVEIPGRTERDTSPVILQNVNDVYAKAMGLAMILGRFLDEQDVSAKLHHAVVNQAFVRHYGSAVGTQVRIARLSGDSFQIVGVVRDTVNRAQTQETLPEIYVPFTLSGLADQLYILGAVHPESLDRAVREQIYAADRGQPVMDVRTLETVLDNYVYARPRFNLLLFSVFAGLGLIMAVLGVHGVISNSVSQQTREIGIRIALGAGYGQVIGMVLRLAAQLLAIGASVGLIGSLLSAKVLRSMVQNVSTIDAYSLAATLMLLFAAGLSASFWPARRAARVDPMTALREE
jgi:predicted permease